MKINLLSERYVDDGLPAFALSDVQKEHIRSFNEKCTSGIYSFRNRICECGSNDFEVIAQKDRYGLPVDTVICRNCGLIMTNPCLDDTSNALFYDNEYHYIYRSETKPSEQNYEERKHDAHTIIDFIQKHAGMFEGTVLEIGCADGGNVAAFNEKGYTASGIDLSHTYVEFGKNKGLDLYCSDAASFARTGNKYDLVVLNHVLEHFTDLQGELQVIRELVNDDGYLFIAVPGLKYLTFGAYDCDFLLMLQNAHVYNFTKDTLIQAMKKNGFDCVFANEAVYGLFKKGTSVSSFGNFYHDNYNYLMEIENASGNRQLLLIKRAIRELNSSKSCEIILYGTATELDALTQSMPDLSPIRGFFYTDRKSPSEVVEYLINNNLKHLWLVDSARDKDLTQELSELIIDRNISLFSVYREMF